MLINVNNLHKSFDEHVVFDGISLSLSEGDRVALLGPSGCGKSTLLREIKDNPLVERNFSRFAFVYQEPRLMPWFSVFDNVFKICKNEIETERALKAVDLWHWKDKRPNQLSGGMKQRVGIARALSVLPEMLFLDEPFSSLDFALSMRMLTLLGSLIEDAKYLKGLLYVTHNVQEALLLAGRIIVLDGTPAKIIFDETINIPPSTRKLDDPELLLLEKKILQLFIK